MGPLPIDRQLCWSAGDASPRLLTVFPASCDAPLPGALIRYLRAVRTWQNARRASTERARQPTTTSPTRRTQRCDNQRTRPLWRVPVARPLPPLCWHLYRRPSLQRVCSAVPSRAKAALGPLQFLARCPVTRSLVRACQPSVRANVRQSGAERHGLSSTSGVCDSGSRPASTKLTLTVARSVEEIPALARRLLIGRGLQGAEWRSGSADGPAWIHRHSI